MPNKSKPKPKPKRAYQSLARPAPTPEPAPKRRIVEPGPAPTPAGGVTVELLDADRKPVREIRVDGRSRLIQYAHKGGPARQYDHVATRADGVWQYAPSDRLTG